MARSTLSDDQLKQQLSQLPGWQVQEGKLVKRYRFKDFNAAFGFMARCALRAEQLDHHPEWSNVYNRVEVALVTHDAGGITELDLSLAAAMDAYAAAFGPAQDP